MERPASTLYVLLSKVSVLLLLHITGTAVLADDVTVTVDVNITGVDDISCISTSILPVTVLVEYRLLSTLEFTDSPQQWRTLNTISTGENITVFTTDSEVRSIQFRFLQLQHNGSDCSCWHLKLNRWSPIWYCHKCFF